MRLPPHVLILVFALAGCSAKTEDQSAEAKPSALVHTATVQAGSLPETVTAYGAAESTTGSDRAVVAPIDATVTAVRVAVGDPVRAGQTVATFQPAPQAALELAKAAQDAQAAQAALARSQRLRATGLASDADVETARAAAVTAQATLQSLKARAGGVLRSPINGVVQTVAIAPGGLAAAGAPILTLGMVTGARVRLGLDPSSAARVRAGDLVQLASMNGDRQAASRVMAIDPRADPQTRQAAVFAQMPSGARFAAGEPVKAEIVVASRSGVPIVPRTAVLFEGETPYLFVITRGVAQRRDLMLGVETPTQVEVRQGVKAGEKIALDGGTALADGMAVREDKASQ